MLEICELRINNSFRNCLPSGLDYKDLGPVSIVKVGMGTSDFQALKKIAEHVKSKDGESFLYGWGITRKYSKIELAEADLFYLSIECVFQPAGEECGTVYDDSQACKFCGAGRKQVGPLRLNEATIPKNVPVQRETEFLRFQ